MLFWLFSFDLREMSSPFRCALVSSDAGGVSSSYRRHKIWLTSELTFDFSHHHQHNFSLRRRRCGKRRLLFLLGGRGRNSASWHRVMKKFRRRRFERFMRGEVLGNMRWQCWNKVLALINTQSGWQKRKCPKYSSQDSNLFQSHFSIIFSHSITLPEPTVLTLQLKTQFDLFLTIFHKPAPNFTIYGSL